VNFFNELKRRNVFKVAAAYIIVGWLIMQVGDTLGPALLLPGWINSALAFFLILGFPLAMFFAWAFEMTPDGLKKEKEVDRSESIAKITSQKLNNLIIGLLVLALGYFMFDKFVLAPGRNAAEVEAAVQTAQDSTPVATVNERSIAVLPFVNMSEDAANEYFSDGISEEILNALAKVKDLKVAGRTSSFAFKGKDQDLRLIGEILGVEHILEGSVRKSGNQVRITAQLIKASDGFHMWSETFDRQLTDIFKIQDEIAQTILAQMKLELFSQQDQQLASSTTSVQTYELYLRARQLMNQRSLESLQLAEHLLREAIANDDAYAPAYAQLGIVTLLVSDLNYGTTPSQGAREAALPLLQKSLALNPDLAEGWAGLGLYQLQLPGSNETAMDHLRKSLAINPNQIDASNWLQGALSTNGNLIEASKLLNEIVERDPLYPPAIFNLAITNNLTNQPEKALALIKRSSQFLPNNAGMQRTEAMYYGFNQQPALAYPLINSAFQLRPSDPGIRLGLSISLFQLREYERIAASGSGWPLCLALAELKRLEEASIKCHENATRGFEEDISFLFEFLVNHGRENEVIKYVQDRWSDLDSFEKDYPSHDGYAHQTMGAVAQAYRLSGNEDMYDGAMQRFRANLDFQRAMGADNFLMELAEAYYFALSSDADSTLTHLERASAFGYNFDKNTSELWTIYKSLDGDPRFEAVKSTGEQRINANREKLGLEPLSS